MQTYVVSVWEGESNIRHNSDHHVLLEIELPGVQTPRVTEGGELPSREDQFQEFTSREGQELSDTRCDRDAGLTDAEELVDKPSVEPPISECMLGVPGFGQDSEE